ncbi:uroporphyrinogen-III C-methyltransferase [Glaciimonas sp. CA11.2]|uniref:uroporphyrinogen-III C-methyltransferase n=1 Tax=Glaciimonas sp. CA11.2 TaxID=3048601 RepID=UPI002AB3D35B|nr:uroporphyrinogen-III C-methyltransferase [Glaciimonas sp. CA11.2]MDY7547170.1 uroporphyrinogen-III C-methyltransferase [Glaciimonas sp. CA11.2]MEB0162497.1 uroporphyrinogen-III C-methyltransferase [Glaciimonas sp. CA11.2]
MQFTSTSTTNASNVESAASSFGKVVLIGAGPGAADLITVRGARVLAQADVVLHDALVTHDMLALCPQAIKILVGKRCGQLSTAQQFINKQLVDNAKKYSLVVRLKGGDPMLFGRADEELRALEAHGIEVEVVPGITAALAAAASAQQPLTKRGVSRSVAFFTSSTAPDEADQTTIPNCDTLVQYMGGREATATAQRLLAQGRPPSTPVVVVENCSRDNERIFRLELSQLEVGLTQCEGPVLVMIGEALAERVGKVIPTDDALCNQNVA